QLLVEAVEAADVGQDHDGRAAAGPGLGGERGEPVAVRGFEHEIVVRDRRAPDDGHRRHRIELEAHASGSYAGGSRLHRVALLESHVERTDEFERRRARMQALSNELRARTAEVAAGGGTRAVERHRSRGKLLARERIDRLLDPGTAFLEFGALA